MKNILFVVDENKVGGVSILLEDLLKMINLKNKNIDVLVLHNSGDRLNNISNDINIIYGTKYFDAIDLTIKEIIKSKSIKLLLKKIILVFDMKTGLIKYKIKRERKKILNKKYDIEIAFKDGFTAIFTAFGDSIKKIHWLHYDYKLSNPNAKYDKLFNRILPTFDKIIGVSKGVVDDFNKIYSLEDKTSVISNLVDIEKIKNSVVNKRIRNDNDLEFVSVGRLHAIKGYDRLIDIIIDLNNQYKLRNIKFKIYGDGPEKDNLIEKVNFYRLNNIVFFEGSVTNPYKCIEGADLLVLPSLYESFGLVIVEALTLGVPVLATRTANTDILINNNVNGLVVDNSKEGLYEGLEKIIKNKEILKELKLGAKAFNYSEENNKILKQLEDLLR